MNDKKPVTVMLVDDDRDFIELTANVFEAEGFKVIKSFSATEALNLLLKKELNVDIVISDLNMPVKSGIDLLRAIKTLSSRVPFYFLTGNREFSNNDASRAGADGLLYKPASPKELVNVVRKSLLHKPSLHPSTSSKGRKQSN